MRSEAPRRRLAAFALAAGTLLALPLTAWASSIVYSGPLNEEIAAAVPGPNSTSTSSLVLDLGGSVAAATFIAAAGDYNRYWSTYSWGSLSWTNAYTNDVGSTVSLDLSGAYADVDAAGAIRPLSVATDIGAGGTYLPTSSSIVDQVTSDYESTNLLGFIATGSQFNYSTAGSAWPDDRTPYFLGLEIPTGPGTYDYGWIEMENSSGPTAGATILGYAYDTTGASIEAGEISSDTLLSVPEPASLALMLAGLGAMGFLVRRRRASSGQGWK